MANCRICQDSVPQYQTFCSRCGARQTSVPALGSARENFLTHLKDYFREVFRSETEKRFDAACELARFGFDAAIPRLEEIVNLEPENPRFSDILEVFYAGAGDERLSHPMGVPGGPLEDLRPGFSRLGMVRANTKAKEILSWVTKVMQSEKDEFLQYNEAYRGLDEALNGALSMYDNSIAMLSGNSIGHSGRASAYQQVADGILMAYGIFPVRFWTYVENESEWEPVKYGNALLGMCLKQEMPNLEFLTEIIWLCEQAQEDYETALRLDPTDTRACVKLSHVFRQLGKSNEATDYIDKALAILNKAILADNEDKQSYSERAEIFQELGKVELAIADLERLLTLSTRQFEIDSTRRKVEELRKGKVT